MLAAPFTDNHGRAICFMCLSPCSHLTFTHVIHGIQRCQPEWMDPEGATMRLLRLLELACDWSMVRSCSELKMRPRLCRWHTDPKNLQLFALQRKPP